MQYVCGPSSPNTFKRKRETNLRSKENNTHILLYKLMTNQWHRLFLWISLTFPVCQYTWQGGCCPHAVGPNSFRCTGCPTIQPKLTGKSEGKVNVVNRAATRYLITIPCGHMPFLNFSPNVGCSSAGGWSSSVWKISMLYSERAYWNRHTDPFQPYGYADTRSV